MRPLEEFERRGDYLIREDVLEEAERTFERRSPRSRAVDRAMRGTITTDFERWKRLKGRGVDFPGVDTPTSSPRQALADHLGPTERAHMASGGRVSEDVMLVEEPRPLRDEADLTGALGGIADDMWGVSGRLANVLRPGAVPYE